MKRMPPKFAFFVGTTMIAATAAVLLPRCASAAEDGVLGRWFTEGVERGVHVQVFLDAKPDGTYEKLIRAVDGCDTGRASRETGKYTYEQGQLATESETVDGKPVTGSFSDVHDLFNVTRIDASHITLFDTETMLTWTLSLVSTTATFPPPAGCSI